MKQIIYGDGLKKLKAYYVYALKLIVVNGDET